MHQNAQNRSDYKGYTEIATRWMDNDIYGHINNVHYYSFFDTAVNRYLIDRGVLDIHKGQIIAFVVDTACSYARPLAFPDKVTVGLRVSAIGNSSVRYELGIFRNDEDILSASGHFVHVYVDRESGKSVRIPDPTRAVLTALQI